MSQVDGLVADVKAAHKRLASDIPGGVLFAIHLEEWINAKRNLAAFIESQTQSQVDNSLPMGIGVEKLQGKFQTGGAGVPLHARPRIDSRI